MRATLERVENSRALLSVEVAVPRVEAALELACRRLAQRTDIPGFRRGKAPRPVVERHLGRDALWREALDSLAREAFGEAVRQTGIEPVADPEFEDVQARDGEPVTFRVAVDVRPQVRLGDYRSLRIPVEVPEVTPEQVERYLEALREKHARFVADPEAEAAPGLYGWITYEGTIGGRQVKSPLVLVAFGRDQLLPGVEEALLGARAGEERQVDAAVPADFEQADLAGQDVHLRVKVHSVGRKQVPQLDQEFASYLGVPGPEELRIQAENTLKAAVAREAEAQALARALEAAVSQAEVGALPASLVERRLRSLVNEWAAELERLQETPEAYCARRGLTVEAVVEQLRERAERQIRTELVLEEIARRENLGVSDEEIAERLDKTGLPPAAAPAVRRALAAQKAADFLRRVALVGPAERQAGATE